MRATESLHRITGHGLVMVVRSPDADHARRVVEAAAAGGVRVIEVTFTVPGAAGLIADLAADPRLHVGAGTVVDRHQAAEAIAAGARYLVSPGLHPGVLQWGLEHEVLTVPGVLTATEVMAATDQGAQAVKLFPAEPLGTSYLRSLRGPFPGLSVIPSGGITPDSATRWLDAGAVAVGIGGALSPTGRLDDHVLSTVTKQARATLAALDTRKERDNS